MGHGILSPGRLPIPPLERNTHLYYYKRYGKGCQQLFFIKTKNIFKKNIAFSKVIEYNILYSMWYKAIIGNDMMVYENILDAGFRTGLSALKQTHPNNASFKELEAYANEYLLAKTLSTPSKEVTP